MQFQSVSVSAKGLQQCQNVEAQACNELALMTLDWTQGELAEGLRCYRSQKFFAAHEHWESVWLATKGPEKPFLQALIQVAAALHHFQRGNSRGAASLMQTAIHRLKLHTDSFGGIAVASLCEEISEWQEKLKTEDAPADFAPPQIRVCGWGQR
jgi:predicted metal-dependent hydrolase